jgi:hypothetical protein
MSNNTSAKKRKVKGAQANKLPKDKRQKEADEVLCSGGDKFWVMTAIEDGFTNPWVTTQADNNWDDCVEKVKKGVDAWRERQIRFAKEKYGNDMKFDHLDWEEIKKQLWKRKYYYSETDGGINEGLQVSARVVDVSDCDFPDEVWSESD